MDIQKLKGGLVVSCQAFPGEALYGSDIMARFALAAREGGAVAIRANSPGDISAIRRMAELPVIGLWKRNYQDSDLFITPTLSDVRAVIAAGADIVAMDATKRTRPGGETLENIVSAVRRESDRLLMADISTLEEGLYAASIGFDIISTTLSGYTEYSRHSELPDFGLIRALTERLSVPVFAEGRIHTPAQARRCMEYGAFGVIVGAALTRPQIMTQKFIKVMNTAKSRRKQLTEQMDISKGEKQH